MVNGVVTTPNKAIKAARYAGWDLRKLRLLRPLIATLGKNMDRRTFIATSALMALPSLGSSIQRIDAGNAGARLTQEHFEKFAQLYGDKPASLSNAVVLDIHGEKSNDSRNTKVIVEHPYFVPVSISSPGLHPSRISIFISDVSGSNMRLVASFSVSPAFAGFIATRIKLPKFDGWWRLWAAADGTDRVHVASVHAGRYLCEAY